MKRRKTKIQFQGPAFRIVGNGSIMGPLRDGANLPVLVVDSSIAPGLRQAIEAARYELPGDVRVAWGHHPLTRAPLIWVILLRPFPLEFVILFDMPGDGLLINTVLEARGFYLKAGGPDDSFKSTFNSPSIIIDVPPTDFNTDWPASYITALMNEYRIRGLKAPAARAAAEKTYKQMNEFSSMRLPVTPNKEDHRD